MVSKRSAVLQVSRDGGRTWADYWTLGPAYERRAASQLTVDYPESFRVVQIGRKAPAQRRG
jgi:hypothetical protein